MKAKTSAPDPSTEAALVTGASSGIGLHLSREFARHGHPVILVAPVQAELDRVAAEIRSDFAVGVHAFAHDLREENAVEALFDELAAIGLIPSIVVNNAGLGRWGRFWEGPLAEDISMIRLNVEAPVRLTKRALPLLLQRGGGRILNTASIAGFEPGPLLAVYHATKAFVLSWSEALATELADTSVSVTTLCPGPVDTDFFPKADMVDTGAFQKARVMAPQDVASAAYAALMAGERVVVPGAANKAIVFSRRILPESAQAKMNEKLYERTDPSERTRERGDVEAEAESGESRGR
jgi:Short-chain dehydrogenases of various substrate specificities